ncbi:MAG: XdhC family protein [Chloroflexota bacterium]
MSLYAIFRKRLEEHRAVALATILSGPDEVGGKLLIYRDGTVEGNLGAGDLQPRIAEDAVKLLREEQSRTREYDVDGASYVVFIEVFPVPARLVIVGASQIAVPLSQFASALGYRVIITDARGAFAVEDRFPAADAVLKGWPQDVLPGLEVDEATYVVLLSHDPKFDQPTLEHVLPSAAPYIGAIGSRKTQRERFERLRRQGYSEEQLGRIHGPVGLDLGGRSAEETALAIMAEITAVRRGGSGGVLRHKS